MRVPAALCSAGLLSVALGVPASAVAGTLPTFLEQANAPVASFSNFTQRVLVDDIDSDGDVDVVLSNGGLDNAVGVPQAQLVYLNDGTGMLTASTPLGDATFVRRAVLADLNGDGFLDLFLATAWQTQPRLFLGSSTGAFTAATAQLPTVSLSLADASALDVDDDGDLDLLLADVGIGDPSAIGQSGSLILWLNDGSGTFGTAPATALPTVASSVAWPWSMTTSDLNGDGHLDAIVACRGCLDDVVLHGQGDGTFTDAGTTVPSSPGPAFEYQAGDLDGDGDVDLFVVGDGAADKPRVLDNDGSGTFTDITSTAMTTFEAPFGEDRAAALVDLDGDADLDVLIASAGTGNRAWINDGSAVFTVDDTVFTGNVTPSVRHLAVGDHSGDGKLDVVFAQADDDPSSGDGESVNRSFLGSAVPADATPPVVVSTGPAPAEAPTAKASRTLWARAHDHKLPLAQHDLASVTVDWTSPYGSGSVQAAWRGGALWHATLTDPLLVGDVSITWCATDAAGLVGCADPLLATLTGVLPEDTDVPEDTDGLDNTDCDEDTDEYDGEFCKDTFARDDDAPVETDTPDDDKKAGGCSSLGAGRAGWLGLAALIVTTRRRRSQRGA